jgi:hypothetical protein
MAGLIAAFAGFFNDIKALANIEKDVPVQRSAKKAKKEAKADLFEGLQTQLENFSFEEDEAEIKSWTEFINNLRTYIETEEKDQQQAFAFTAAGLRSGRLGWTAVGKHKLEATLTTLQYLKRELDKKQRESKVKLPTAFYTHIRQLLTKLASDVERDIREVSQQLSRAQVRQAQKDRDFGHWQSKMKQRAPAAAPRRGFATRRR